MKPKFRLGDRVTVIKPYVAPSPIMSRAAKSLMICTRLLAWTKISAASSPAIPIPSLNPNPNPAPVPTAKLFMPILTRAKPASVLVLSCGKMNSNWSKPPSPPRKTMTKSRIPSPSRSKSHWTIRPKLTASLTKLSSWLSSPMPLSPRPSMIPPPSPGLMMKSQQPAKRLLNCPPASRNRAAI